MQTLSVGGLRCMLSALIHVRSWGLARIACLPFQLTLNRVALSFSMTVVSPASSAISASTYPGWVGQGHTWVFDLLRLRCPVLRAELVK
jgi:hypothetical protein